MNFESFLYPFKEPVGSKKPTFSTESTSIGFMKHHGQSFALLCQAQAFPVPLIRLVLSKRKFDKQCKYTLIFGFLCQKITRANKYYLY